MQMKPNYIQVAIEVYGTQENLAGILRTTQATVSRWKTSGRVPAKRAVEIERITGGIVTRRQLRPDLYQGS